MKKTILLIFALLLATAFTVIPALATNGGTAAVGQVEGFAGQTVTVGVSLSGFAKADTIGISFTYDSRLQLDEDSSGWLLDGELDALDATNNRAAWCSKDSAADDTVEVNGDIFKFTFVVPEPEVGQTDLAYPISCQIQVIANDTILGTVNASGKVTVKKPAESVTMAGAMALDLSGTKTQTLTATVLPENTTDRVTWHSSDETVAIVSACTVTALKKGTAVITATAGGKTASCTVTVTCSHDLQVHTAVTPSCQGGGNNLYYTCGNCPSVLKADRTTETTVAAETLAILPHDYETTWRTDSANHWHKCKDCNATTGTQAHDFQWFTDTKPSEDNTGTKHEECTVCALKRNEGTVIDKLPHTHVNITRHGAVAATCVAGGNVEYWTCGSSKCAGKYYGDANCSRELANVTTGINADNHKTTEIRGAVKPTCFQPGYSGDTHCKACDKKLASGQTLPATENHVAGTAWYTDDTHHWHICKTSGCGAVVEKKSHSYQWKLDKEATEDTTGLKHEECVCGVKRSEGTVIPKLDHKHIGIRHYEAVKATCVKAGTVEYWTCSSHKCSGKYYSDSKCQLELETVKEAIDPDNHAGKTELRNAVEATCSENGYSGDTYCTSCKALVKKGAVVPATGKHTPKAGYEKDEKLHWRLCSYCDALIGNAKEEHTYSWIVEKNPTETEEGSKYQKCTACGHTCNADTPIDKLPHTPVKVEGKEPTCTEDGALTHYLCENCGKYYADDNGQPGKEISVEEITLKATGHSFDTKWTTDVEGHWHECACGEKGDQEAHKTEVVNAKEATEAETGYTGDTVCSVCQYEVAKGQEIPVIVEPSKGVSPVVWVVVAAVAAGAGACIFLLKKRKV